MVKRLAILFLLVTPVAWIVGQAFTFEDLTGVHPRHSAPATVGPSDASHSTIAPATEIIPADGASTQTILVQARDYSGNNETNGGDTVVIFRFSGTGSVGSTTDNGNGTYTAVLTSASSTGTGTIEALLNGNPVGTAVGASTSIATYGTPTVSASYSTVTSYPTNITADGSASSVVTITVKNTGNVAMPGQTVSLSLPGTHSYSIGSPSATDGSGQTTASFVTTLSQVATVHASVGAVSITQYASIICLAGAVNAYSSSASASPSTGVASDGVATSTITVTLSDANFNPCVGKTVTFSVSGGTGNTTSTPAVTDSSGTTTGTIKSTSSGVKTITVAGDGVTIAAAPTVTFL
jgi:adhesin/invasin